MSRLLATLTALVILLVASSARATPRASFAIIIGSNTSVDPGVTPLHYADDDAARYFDFFRQLGTKVTLLSRIDDETRALHPQAAAEAQLPRRAELVKAVTDVASAVTEARHRGLEPVLYFVFAGHGGVDETRGYLALEDARLTGEDLGHMVVDKVDAQTIHLILDACNSYLVAYSRGPGGERRPAQDYTRDVYELARNPRVGLLLSTSSATESHEWDAFQAGVFSHEVRSGLYGAADADGDGEVSYREIAAFIARANEAIVNQRFRPHAFAQAPNGASTGTLVDLHHANHVTIDGAHAGRYLLEDARGVRLADFHSSPNQTVSLLRPPPNGPSYLRQLDTGDELVIPAGDGDVSVNDLTSEPTRVASRGAIHASFSSLFAYPFDELVVEQYREPPPPPLPPEQPKKSIRPIIGAGLVGLGAVGVGVGTFFAVDAHSSVSASADQRQVSAQNEHNRTARGLAIGSFIVGGALAVSGAVVWIGPGSATFRAVF